MALCTANKTLGVFVGKGGKASDLQLATDLVAEGATLAEVAEVHRTAYVRNYKGNEIHDSRYATPH